jgi:hypothetical protein
VLVRQWQREGDRRGVAIRDIVIVQERVLRPHGPDGAECPRGSFLCKGAESGQGGLARERKIAVDRSGQREGG